MLPERDEDAVSTADFPDMYIYVHRDLSIGDVPRLSAASNDREEETKKPRDNRQTFRGFTAELSSFLSSLCIMNCIQQQPSVGPCIDERDGDDSFIISAYSSSLLLLRSSIRVQHVSVKRTSSGSSRRGIGDLDYTSPSGALLLLLSSSAPNTIDWPASLEKAVWVLSSSML